MGEDSKVKDIEKTLRKALHYKDLTDLLFDSAELFYFLKITHYRGELLDIFLFNNLTYVLNHPLLDENLKTFEDMSHYLTTFEDEQSFHYPIGVMPISKKEEFTERINLKDIEAAKRTSSDFVEANFSRWLRDIKKKMSQLAKKYEKDDFEEVLKKAPQN